MTLVRGPLAASNAREQGHRLRLPHVTSSKVRDSALPKARCTSAVTPLRRGRLGADSLAVCRHAVAVLENCAQASRIGQKNSPNLGVLIEAYTSAPTLPASCQLRVASRRQRLWPPRGDWDEYVIAGNVGVIPWVAMAMACCAVRPAPLDDTASRRR
jgi:hypothetical protein